MALEELDAALDAMLLAAGDNPDLAPGLITVQTDDLMRDVSATRATCKALHDVLALHYGRRSTRPACRSRS